MPTNRSRVTRNRIQVEPWQEFYLLYGEAPHSSIKNRKSILPYCNMPRFGGKCFAHEDVWPEYWEELKSDILPQFRQDNPGQKCFAEIELEKINGNQSQN